MTLTRRIRSYFLHGLAVLLPTILTIWLFVWGYTFIQEKISIHINRGIVYIIARLAHERIEISDNEVRAYIRQIMPELSENEPELEFHLKRPDIQRKACIQKIENRLAKTWVDGPGSITGFLIAVVGVWALGALLTSYIGNTLWHTIEKFITNTPFVKRVFPYIKQFTDFLLTPDEQKKMLLKVVAVEYPRKGIWTLGYVTGSGLEDVGNIVRKEFLTIFIPTAPNPLTGFVITIPNKHVIDLDMTVEEAFRFVVSGGIVAPDSEHAVADLHKLEPPKKDSST